VNNLKTLKKWRLIFAGTPSYAIPSLEALAAMPQIEIVGVITQKPKPNGRGYKLTPSPVATFAQNKGFLVLTPDTLKNTEFKAVLKSMNADVAIVIAYGKIIPTDLLEFLPLGWLNLHASLLSRWRGAAPIQHALIAGDAETGVSLMQIQAGLDSGPVFKMIKTHILQDETATTLAEKLAFLSAKILNESLIECLLGNLRAKPQSETGVTVAPKIEKSDGEIFWSESAIKIERKIRALNPWPGTFCKWGDSTLLIRSAKTSPEKTAMGLVVKHPEGCVIGAGQGSIIPKTVQLPGKKPSSIQNFLIGHPGFVGTNLANSS
jgi:methionyl-tRNA formyltransferase